MSGVALLSVVTSFPDNEHHVRPWSAGPCLGPGSSAHQLWGLRQVMLISSSRRWGNDSSSPHRVVGKSSSWCVSVKDTVGHLENILLHILLHRLALSGLRGKGWGCGNEPK